MTNGFTIRLRTHSDVEEAEAWLKRAAMGWWVKFWEPTRSDKQNARMWAMLAEVAKVGQVNGKKYAPDQWKAMFMQAMGEEVDFLPTLDGKTFFPYGHRSSQLTIKQMVALQDFMEAWAAEQGIELGGHDD